MPCNKYLNMPKEKTCMQAANLSKPKTDETPARLVLMKLPIATPIIEAFQVRIKRAPKP